MLWPYWNRLVARVEVTLEHQADDGIVTIEPLLDDIVPGEPLFLVILVAVAVRTVDDHARIQARGNEAFVRFSERFLRVVRAAAAPSNDEVTIGIAGRIDDARVAVLIDSEETVGILRSDHGIERGLQSAVRRILVPHGHR